MEDLQDVVYASSYPGHTIEIRHFQEMNTTRIDIINDAGTHCISIKNGGIRVVQFDDGKSRIHYETPGFANENDTGAETDNNS